MSLYSTTALSLVVLDTDWVPPSGSVVDLHLVQLEVDVDVHSGREGHWVRNRTQWIRFRTQLDIMHKQTWINHDRITLFKKFFQFPSLLIIVEFSTLKNLGNLTTKNSTHHEFVATDHEFVATDHEFVATDYEFVVWTSFIYWIWREYWVSGGPTRLHQEDFLTFLSHFLVHWFPSARVRSCPTRFQCPYY